MAEIVFIDGQALDPTSFGEFDSTTVAYGSLKIGQQFDLEVQEIMALSDFKKMPA
ncbi:MAG: hypothetical protein CM15mV61_130 [uncultured marine virus]|nr:MAG: hypothetical protein CM15mV61_130 [uncultured marine virus]